jgi:UDP-N-acetylmuramoylalanine--D-glutamate ligase
VICGGSDKHVSFAPLAETLLTRAGGVVLNGETAGKIKAALLADSRWDGSLPMAECSRLAEAVDAARAMARPGDTVLLSPACASFDQFANFEERGNTFKQIVNAW